jgi:Xaa-Pro aminopeptidase
VTAARDVPAADHGRRREQLRERLGTADLDALLLTEPVNVRWATGFTGSNGQLLLRAGGADLLITDARYDERAGVEAPDLERTLSRDPVAVARDMLDPPCRIGFEAEHLTWAAGERLRQRIAEAGGTAQPTNGEVEALRVIKDDHEIALISDACRITTEALTWLLDTHVRLGVTERDLARLLERRFVDLGAEAAAFDTIVASGPNAAIPHHAPTDRPLAAGDVVTIDCGAKVDGYHADCTRTFALGHLDAPLDEVYETVRAAQAAGREAAVAGSTGADVDAAARAVIDDAGYGEAFVHGTGHGVGLEIHEAPAVSRGAPATLVAGMTLTVEPGVYLPGIGGVRLEDTVVVTADGPAKPLTDLPRELRLL